MWMADEIAKHSTFWKATSWFPSPALKLGRSTSDAGMTDADREWEKYLPGTTTAANWCPSGEAGTRWLHRLYKEAAANHSAVCHGGMQRVGGNGDGGKYVCRSLVDKEHCLVYSLGSGNNFLFELAMAEQFNCEVHTFDCTTPDPTRRPANNTAITFHPWCVSGKDAGHHFTLRTIRQKLNHDRRNLTVMKMDIERHEYAVVAAMSGDQLPQQLLFEAHLHNGYGSWGRPVLRREWTQFWHTLWQYNYAAFSHEPNPKCKCCCEFSLMLAPPAVS